MSRRWNDDLSAHQMECRLAEAKVSNKWWLVLLFLLTIGYPLSIGPVGKLVCRPSSPDPPAVTAFYRPVLIVAGHCPPIYDALEWYLFRVWHVGQPPYWSRPRWL